MNGLPTLPLQSQTSSSKVIMKFTMYHTNIYRPVIAAFVVIIVIYCQLFNLVVAGRREAPTLDNKDAYLMRVLQEARKDMDGLLLQESVFNNSPDPTNWNSDHTHCTNCTHCDLSASGIESINTAFDRIHCNLSKIRTLNLSNNAIENIPDGIFTNMTQLQWIDLSNNRIKTMGTIDTSNEIRTLQTILLANNNLIHLPSIATRVIETKEQNFEINIGGNPFACDDIMYDRVIKQNIQDEGIVFIGATCKSPFLLHPTPLFTASGDVNINSKMFGVWDSAHCPSDCSCFTRLYDNRHFTKCKPGNFTTIPIDIWNETNVLSLIDYSIDSLPIKPISRLHKLEELHAEDIGIKTIDHGVFSNLQHLKLINMSENNLRSISPSDFNDVLTLEKLFLDSNKITGVTNESFTNLVRLQNLTLHHNRLTSVPVDLFDSIRNLQHMTLHGNELEFLPKNSFENNTLLEFLTLPKHYFRCDCRTIWLKEWMQQADCPVQDPDTVLCNETMEPILQTPIDEFRHRCLHHATFTLPTIAVAILFVFIICLILINKDLVLVTIYTISGFRCGDRRANRHDDDGRPFDAVIIYDNSDFEFAFYELFQRLDPEGPYKVCFEGKDFVPGYTKMDNILKAVEYSRRTILVLSKRFLDNEECAFAFQTAHRENLRDHVNRIIVIQMENMKRNGLDGELQTYLSRSTNSKIMKDSRLFWQKLHYRMPDVSSHREPYVPIEGSHPFASLINIGPRQPSLVHMSDVDDDDDDFCILDTRYHMSERAVRSLNEESNSTLECNESLLNTRSDSQRRCDEKTTHRLKVNTTSACAINMPITPSVRSPMTSSLLKWPQTQWQDNQDDTVDLLDFTFEMNEDSLEDRVEAPTFKGKLSLLPLF